MSEWTVVNVLGVLLCMIATVTVPIVYSSNKATNKMSELTANMVNLTEKLNGHIARNNAAHERLWNRIDNQEGRIIVVEERTKQGGS